MARSARRLACLVGAAAAAAAQVHPGSNAPALPLQVVVGPAAGETAKEPVAFDSASVAVLVLAFAEDLATAAGDGDQLRDLLQRHRDGCAVVVVAPDAAGTPVPPALAGLRLAADADGRLRTQWLGAESEFDRVIVARGRVAWVGGPGDGLGAAVARALGGRLDPAESGQRWRRRRQLLETFAESTGSAAEVLAQELLQTERADGTVWGLCYLAQSQRGNAAAAALTAGAAIEALAAEPRALATFADLAMRGDGRNRALGRQLVAPLAQAATSHPDDPCVQLARLLALVRAGEGREVGMLAHRLARRCEAVPTAALALVSILAQDDPPEVHRDLCASVLRAIADRPVDPRWLAAARFVVRLRCDGDAAAARELASDYMEPALGRASLNDDAWRLLTDRATMGRFDSFALALAERMLEQQAAMEPFELDTAALAMFRNGRFAEAARLQQTAIDRGGEEPAYAERLDRFRAAADRRAPR